MSSHPAVCSVNAEGFAFCWICLFSLEHSCYYCWIANEASDIKKNAKEEQSSIELVNISLFINIKLVNIKNIQYINI